jgi:hypothetical protein
MEDKIKIRDIDLLYKNNLNLDYDNVLSNIISINPEFYDLNIIEKGLIKYVKIMQYYNVSEDLSKDLKFQTLYDGFYRVRRNKDWRKYYFELMQDVRNKDVSFSDIVKIMYEKTHRIEASFSSKLLATINTKYPIIDQYVLKNLGIRNIPSNIDSNEKLKRIIDNYNYICVLYGAIVDSKEGKEKIEFFNSKFPEYKWISDTKKIDFLLWSKR